MQQSGFHEGYISRLVRFYFLSSDNLNLYAILIVKEGDNMDAPILGKRIADLRKEKGMTQRELAEILHITDGAVSKWERGINFPDLSLIEHLAVALDTNVITLLSLEGSTKNEVAKVISDISICEKNKLIKDIKQRAVLHIIIGSILLICLFTASYLFHKNNIYGLAQGVTLGAFSFVGTLIGSEYIVIRNAGKI